VVAAAALVGLVLGVAALVLSLALLSGFQAHVRTRLAEEAPHVLVSPAGRSDFAAAEGLAARLAAIPGVVEHGLFVHIATMAIIAGSDGLTIVEQS